MEQPVEVAHYNDAQGNIMCAVYVCEVTGVADVGVYGAPGEGVVFRSPEFADVDGAIDWMDKRAPSINGGG